MSRTLPASARLLLPAVLAVLVLLVPWLGVGPYWVREIGLVLMLALVVSGLNLSLGYAGELALGQIAFYAVGAYVSGYLASHATTDLFANLAAGAAAALVVGLVSGIPGLRLGGWSLAMTSFFLVLLVPDLVTVLNRWTGGQIGLFGIPPLTLFGHALGSKGYYLAIAVVAILWFAVLRNLLTSRHGTALLVLRQSPVLASSLGISTQRMKLTAYALGAVPAGLAGALFANLDHFITPQSPGPFDFSQSIAVLAAAVLGGLTSVYGALFGAVVLQLGPMRFTAFQKYSDIVYGAFLILFGVLLSQGGAGVVKRLSRRVLPAVPSPARRPADRAALQSPLPGQQLSVTDVVKTFGGLRALDGVTLSAQPGQVTSIIGPNGSGKTTLLNLISGFYRPSAGAIRIGDRTLTRRGGHRVARLGVARTFQTPLIPRDLTVAECVAAGRFHPDYRSIPATVVRTPGYRRTRRADQAAVAAALAATGLEHCADEDASAQPVGTRRLIEIARALVARPGVLLFDEIASGLDDNEIDQLAELIRALRDAGATVVLVEHNFSLVLRVSDVVHLLAGGALVASGAPADIAEDPAILREYLGITEDALAPTVGEELGQPT